MQDADLLCPFPELFFCMACSWYLRIGLYGRTAGGDEIGTLRLLESFLLVRLTWKTSQMKAEIVNNEGRPTILAQRRYFRKNIWNSYLDEGLKRAYHEGMTRPKNWPCQIIKNFWHSLSRGVCLCDAEVNKIYNSRLATLRTGYFFVMLLFCFCFPFFHGGRCQLPCRRLGRCTFERRLEPKKKLTLRWFHCFWAQKCCINTTLSI